MNRKPIITLIQLFIALVFIIVGCQNTFGEGEMSITKGKAINIANNELVNLGYNVKEMVLKSADIYNSDWETKLSKDKALYRWTKNICTDNKSKCKTFWLLYYSRGEFVLGGDIAIYVDANSGKIIGYKRGK